MNRYRKELSAALARAESAEAELRNLVAAYRSDSCPDGDLWDALARAERYVIGKKEAPDA